MKTRHLQESRLALSRQGFCLELEAPGRGHLHGGGEQNWIWEASRLNFCLLLTRPADPGLRCILTSCRMSRNERDKIKRTMLRRTS